MSLAPRLESQLPQVTVIMPVRNEADAIRQSLGSVIEQDYPAELLEILVADGRSDDATREIVRQIAARTPQLEIRLVDNPGRIVPTGINLAMRQARGDVIVRVDGHCEIAPDYVRRCVQHLRQDRIDGVGGPIENVGQTFLARSIAVAMGSRFGVGGGSFRTCQSVTKETDTIPFPAYTRTAVELAGPYDEQLVRNQDDEYNYRLRKLGARLLLASDVRSRYYSRPTLRGLWRQYFQYGYWKIRVLQKHPRQMRPRQFVPVTFVFAVLGCLLLLPVWPGASWALALICLAYAIASLVASLVAARYVGWLALPLPVIFAILHFAYGLGNLWGLIRFAGSWSNPTTPSASGDHKMSTFKAGQLP